MTENCSQFNTMYGPTIDREVMVHKMGVTTLLHFQANQYLRYWKTGQRRGHVPTTPTFTGTPQHAGGHRKRTLIQCLARRTRKCTDFDPSEFNFFFNFFERSLTERSNALLVPPWGAGRF